MSSKCKVLIFLQLLAGICLVWMETRPEFSFNLLNFSSSDCDSVTATDVDPWFTTHFNRSVEPFLTTKNNLSEFHFKWWKKLQFDRSSYAHYKATVDKVFQVFPSPPDEPSFGRCRTCSVVGNSGNLRSAHYGSLIDYQDLVIRINQGDTKGYEQHVGTRTTHRVIYPHSAMNVSNSDTHIVLFPFKTNDLEWIIKASDTGFFGRQHFTKKGLVMILNPAFMKYVHDGWLGRKGQYPSTGFMTLVLAIHMCEEVHVFGFGADRHGHWSHYWEELKNKKLKTGNHNGQREFQVILKLAETHKVKFYTGY